MSIFKRVPWVSVVLVLLSYSTLGWVVSETKPPQFVWLVLIFGILLLVGSLTIPWSKMTDFSVFLFKSKYQDIYFCDFSSFFVLFDDCLVSGVS